MIDQPEQYDWLVQPISDNHWQAWLGNRLMQDNIYSANEAWDWVDKYCNPIEDYIPCGFRVKNIVR